MRELFNWYITSGGALVVYKCTLNVFNVRNGFENIENKITKRERRILMSNLVITFMLMCMLINPADLGPINQEDLNLPQDTKTKATVKSAVTNRDNDGGDFGEEEIFHEDVFFDPGDPSIMCMEILEDGRERYYVTKGGEVVSEVICGTPYPEPNLTEGEQERKDNEETAEGEVPNTEANVEPQVLEASAK